MHEETVEKYKHLYKEMHDDGHFKGGSLKKEYIDIIKALVKTTNAQTVLDFGCGKASAYKQEKPINIFFGIKSENMSFYDIGVKEYEVLPTGTFDGVISTDVLEHIPEELIDGALETIFSKGTKFVFLVIACGLAVKKLPNGENAHLTVKPPDWWNAKIKKYYDKKRFIHVKYMIPVDPVHNILNLR